MGHGTVFFRANLHVQSHADCNKPIAGLGAAVSAVLWGQEERKSTGGAGRGANEAVLAAPVQQGALLVLLVASSRIYTPLKIRSVSYSVVTYSVLTDVYPPFGLRDVLVT